MKKIVRKIAFELFREWTKKALAKYSHNDFTIIDETCLIEDMEESLNNAISSLLKKERAEERTTPGYDYGFVLGFIQGNLNSYWYNEYIVRRTDVYKGYVINKAFFEYLKFNDIERVRITALYEWLLKKGLNLESIDVGIDKKQFTKYGLDDIEPGDISADSNNAVLVYLENRINEQIIEIVEMSDSNFLPDLENYFSEAMIMQMIDEY